jgi:lipoate-protein ligase A
MLPLDFYRRISEAIAAGLQLLGAVIAFAPGEKLHHEGKPLRLACFASSARHELIANGKKIAGSAQRRFREGTLQHGSILFRREHERLADYLVAAPEEIATERLRLRRHTTTLADILPLPIGFDDAAQALRTGFEKALGLDFVEQEALAAENELAETWRERYRILKTNFQEKMVCSTFESC